MFSGARRRGRVRAARRRRCAGTPPSAYRSSLLPAIRCAAFFAFFCARWFGAFIRHARLHFSAMPLFSLLRLRFLA